MVADIGVETFRALAWGCWGCEEDSRFLFA